MPNTIRRRGLPAGIPALDKCVCRTEGQDPTQVAKNILAIGAFSKRMREVARRSEHPN